MKYAAFLLIILTLSWGTEKGEKSAVSLDSAEGKKVYVPINPPIDPSKEVYIQEYDQNRTYHGSQK